jgi:UDP-glucose 4-epimerase
LRQIIFGSKGFLGSTFFKKLKNSICVNEIEDLDNEKLFKVDILINCAGASNVSYSFENPIIDFHKNTYLVQQLLEKIRKSGNKNIRFINLSSAAVYGNPQKLPIKENSEIKPLSPYGFHKKMAEDLCLEYSQCFGLKTLSLRIFSAYGDGQKKMLLWDLHQKIINSNGHVNLFGSGIESRDYIHVNDILQQIILAINNADFRGEAINVGNGKEIKVKEIVDIYKAYHSKAFEFSFNGENRPGDPLNWCADISKMKEWGYIQTVNIEQGVMDYINWVKNLKLT